MLFSLFSVFLTQALPLPLNPFRYMWFVFKTFHYQGLQHWNTIG
uniref:Uncharacterized protein n=1 Tax=Arundo donax TaxID=35708 RepID=A0A0A9FWI8_ARUDO